MLALFDSKLKIPFTTTFLRYKLIIFVLAHTNFNFREHLPISAKLIEIDAWNLVKYL